MNHPIAGIIVSLSVLLLPGCMSLGPARDTDAKTTLFLQTTPDPATYPAPVFEVSLPSYLNEGTVWYANAEGRLEVVDGWLWAESLSSAIRRELSLALGKAQPYPDDARIDLTFSRFLLLDDGSAVAVVEGEYSSGGKTRTFPVTRISLESAWDPSVPSSFLGGYRTLLESTAARLSTLLAPMVKTQ